MDAKTTENKDIVQRFYTHLQNEDYKSATRLCHEDFVFYLQLDSPIRGTDGFVESEKQNFDAFKGFQFTIEQIFTDKDSVGVFMIFDGNQSGTLMDIEPIGNQVRFSLMMLLKVQDGKIIEKRAHFDKADILRQLEK